MQEKLTLKSESLMLNKYEFSHVGSSSNKKVGTRQELVSSMYSLMVTKDWVVTLKEF